MASDKLDKFRCSVVEGGRAIQVAIASENDALAWRRTDWRLSRMRLSRTSCKIKLRAADNLEHVGSRGLLLQRLSKVGGALTQFVEQPRVLDGDDGLSGEVLYQFDLLLGEWAHLVAERA